MKWARKILSNGSYIWFQSWCARTHQYHSSLRQVWFLGHIFLSKIYMWKTSPWVSLYKKLYTLDEIFYVSADASTYMCQIWDSHPHHLPFRRTHQLIFVKRGIPIHTIYLNDNKLNETSGNPECHLWFVEFRCNIF